MCAKVLLMTDDLNIIIKRSANRKSASLAIYPDQRIVVSVPNRFPDARVEALIRDKINWIQKKLSELRALPQLKTYELKEGESLPFLGEELRLTFQVSSKSSVLRVENALLVSLPMTMRSASPRITAPNNMVVRSPTCTSPLRMAFGAM